MILILISTFACTHAASYTFIDLLLSAQQGRLICDAATELVQLPATGYDPSIYLTATAACVAKSSVTCAPDAKFLPPS